MPNDSDDPGDVTIGDVFRVVNAMRSEMRTEHTQLRNELTEFRTQVAEFRTDMDDQLTEIRRRLAGQSEAALNLALHVLGEQREKLREVVAWANTQGARIENLP